jgi:hypothetical protein
VPLTVPSTVFPSERRGVGVAREPAGSVGTALVPSTWVPVVNFVPEDKPMWLPDESLRNAMAMTYGLIQGPYVADLTFDASPVYMDSIGHFLYNILGDYTASGVSTGTTGTLLAGGTGYPLLTTGTIIVPQGSNFAAGAPGYVQLDATGTNSEIVGYSSASGTTIVLSGTTRITHSASASVYQVGGPYKHVFSLLNGTGNAQPPTHTITDRTYIPAGQARWYPFTCISEMTFTGNAEKLFEWSGKGVGYANQEPGTGTVTTSTFGAVPAEPSWNSAFGLAGVASGGSQIYQVGEWAFTLTRVVEPYFTADGTQNPYIIGRGKFSTTGKVTFSPTINEVPLTEMLNNVQPQIQVVQTNSLAGTQLESMQFDVQVCAFDAAVIEPGKALFGYADGFQAVANTTNTGNTGGYGPVQVTLNNQVPTY